MSGERDGCDTRPVSESDAIEKSERPATVSSLVSDLRSLGIETGMTVMAHASLSRLGYVAGGAHAVVTALLEAVGSGGTLVMPTHSNDLSDPASWQNPPIPESWWATVRDEMPVYDPLLTPTRAMGAVVECFRHVPGVVRSGHPTVSAAAHGPNAAVITAGHEFADGLGEASPQARIYELDGHVLLLGVTHENNTALHLSERRAELGLAKGTAGSPVNVDGVRRWQTYEWLEDDSSDFERLGEDFAVTGNEVRGGVGIGTARFMRSRDIVDFGITWMQANRAATRR